MSLTTLTLDCGMPLLVESIPGVRSVGVAWYVPAGYAGEAENRQGASAMWTELLQRGCGERDSRGQADALDRLGITRSVDNGAIFMRLSFTLLGTRVLESLPVITDMVRRPRMDEDSIEPVRDLCLQAIESLRDDPPERASLSLRERHAPPPVNRSGLGTEEGLGALTRDELRSAWERRARPGDSIMAVAGEVDSAGGAEGIAAALNNLLGGWEGRSPELVLGQPPARGTYHHIEDASAQVHIVLAHEAPKEMHPDVPLERVVSSVLSGGMSSRLFSEVREKRGLCYSVSQSYSAERDWGQCSAYVGTTPERAQESLTVLLAELNRMGEAGSAADRITREEFDVALTGIKSRLVFSGESTAARAHALASDQYKRGRGRTLREIAAGYDAVTLEAVNEYLARRRMGPITIVSLGSAPLQPPM